MTSSTNRQYILNPNELEIDFLILNLAEQMIDDLLPVYRTGKRESKSVNGSIVVKVDIVSNKIILPEELLRETNYYQYLIVENLKNGEIYPIKSSEGGELTHNYSNLSNQTDLKVKIYQLGKMPMKMHFKEGIKSIPTQIREASLWQAKYLYKNQDLLEDIQFESASEGVSSASYKIATNFQAIDRLYSGVAKSIVKSLGFYQTI